MQKLVYYLIYPVIWLISILPFSILYVLSDILYIILYYIVGYRKKLVLSNLKRSFPNKSKKELRVIRYKFYKHFVDISLEMVKTFSISDKEITKRYKFNNISLLDDIYKKGKSIIIVGSHYGNWEWSVSMSLHTKIIAYGTYTRINNEVLENKTKTNRERFGGKVILQENTIRNMAKNYKKNKARIYGLLSDQSPLLIRSSYWTDFLGVRIPIHIGAEKLAKRYNCAFVYMQVNKVKRGYYTIDFETISENPREVSDYELTDAFLQKTEKQIRNKPEYYLWSHNRFKHEGKEK